MTKTENAAVLFSQLDRLVREEADVDALHRPIRKLLALAPRSIGMTLPRGVSLYRATKHHRAHPESLADLWFPPPERASLGRANRANSPIFYCASDPNCAFGEIGAEPGDLVVCASWVTCEPLTLHDLGYTQQVLSRTGMRALPSYHQAFHESLDEQSQTIREYLASAFTRPGSTGYRLSAAIAEVHTNQASWAPDDNAVHPLARVVTFAGIMYPALSRDLRVDNVAILPDAVRACLRLRDAKLIEVVKVERGGDFALELRDIATLSAADGNSLTWRAAVPVQSLAPGGARPLGRGETHRFYESSEIGIQGKRYRIEPGYTVQRTQTDEVIVRDLRGERVSPSP